MKTELSIVHVQLSKLDTSRALFESEAVIKDCPSKGHVFIGTNGQLDLGFSRRQLSKAPKGPGQVLAGGQA